MNATGQGAVLRGTAAESGARRAEDWLSPRHVIVTGLVVGVACGQAGNFFKPGPAQNYLYALSSVGLVTGAVVLAIREARRRRELVAAGFALLAVAETLIWTGGPGAAASLAAGTLFYIPALVLISLPAALPPAARIIGLMAALPWAAYAAAYLTAPSAEPALAIKVAGYLLLSAAAVAWIVTVIREGEA